MKNGSPSSIGITGALKEIGSFVPYHPKIARAVGVKEAIFLEQVLFLSNIAKKEEEGWVYMDSFSIKEKTALTYKEQLRIRETLKSLGRLHPDKDEDPNNPDPGVLDEENHRLEHQLYFRVNESLLDALVKKADEEWEKEKEEREERSKHNSDNGISPNDQTSFGRTPNGCLATRPKGVSLDSSKNLAKETLNNPTLADLDDPEEETSTSTSKTTPPSKERSSDPKEVYRVAKGIYRTHCKKNLGGLGEKQMEAWVGALEGYGREKLLGALEIWAKELGVAGAGRLDYPIAVFLKNIEEFVEAYEMELSPGGEEEEQSKAGGVDSPTKAYLNMLKLEDEKLKKRREEERKK